MGWVFFIGGFILTPLHAFCWGAVGSIAIELLVLTLAINRRRNTAFLFPAYYRQMGFWVTRFVVTILAGAVAALERAHNIPLAVNVGAAVPAIISLLVSRWG
jgi:hypothetical protein